MSGFLDQAYGFVPIVMPITEPAVGYGARGRAGCSSTNPQGEAQAGFGRPNITAVGGAGHGKRHLGRGGRGRAPLAGRPAADARGGVVYASVNLDFYGIGEDGVLDDHPLTYNLEPFGGLVQAKYRLGTRASGPASSYAFAATQVSFDAPDGTPGLPDFPSASPTSAG